MGYKWKFAACILVLVFCCLGASAQTPPKDVSGWRDAKWGMTEEQLQKLFKSEVTRLPQTRRGSAYHSNLVIPAYEVAGTKFEVTFNIDNETNTLAEVTLRPTDESSLYFPQALFKRLEALLAEKYGSPTRRTRPEDKQDTPGMASVEAVWEFASTKISLGYLEHSQPTMKQFNLFSLSYEKPSKVALDRI
jgi:hypothetical protein